jgi:hypothetical protein
MASHGPSFDALVPRHVAARGIDAFQVAAPARDNNRESCGQSVTFAEGSAADRSRARTPMHWSEARDTPAPAKHSQRRKAQREIRNHLVISGRTSIELMLRVGASDFLSELRIQTSDMETPIDLLSLGLTMK